MTPLTYEEKRNAARNRNLAMAMAGRDIGELPEVVNPERKKQCRTNFRLFCEEYFPETFSLEWSPDHLKAIHKIETAVLKGGLVALAMPRGSGKSSLTEVAAIWAMLYGHREFIMLIGATESAALELLDSLMTEFEINEHLAADFPEVCYPIQQLDGIANRCAGQLYHGERTRITWTSNEIVLPTIKDSAASGIVVRVAGITGRIRGMKYKRPDGRSVRPSLVVIDDPRPLSLPGAWNRPASASVCLPGTSSASRVPVRRFRASCPARSFVRATWPTSSSTGRRTRTGTVSARKWCTSSRRT